MTCSHMEEEMTTMSKRERTIAPTSRWRLRAAAAGAVMATVALAGVHQLGAQQPSGRTITFGVTLFDGLKNVSSLRSAQLDERAGEQDLARAKQTAVFTVASNFLALVSQQVALEVRRVDRGSEERKSEERRALARFFRLSSSIGAAHVGAHQATPHRRRDAVPSRRGVAASSGGAHVVHAHGVARRRQ